MTTKDDVIMADNNQVNPWFPIDDAPKDRVIEVYAPPYEGLSAIVCLCEWHSIAGFCIDELRYPTHYRKHNPPTNDTGKTGSFFRLHRLPTHLPDLSDAVLVRAEAAEARVAELTVALKVLRDDYHLMCVNAGMSAAMADHACAKTDEVLRRGRDG